MKKLSKLVLLSLIIGGLALFVLGLFVGKGYGENTTKLDNTDATQAFNAVISQQDVKSWLLLFDGPNQTSKKTGGKPVVAIDGYDKEGSVIIHVYEYVPSDGHTVTFGWYKYNKKINTLEKTL